MIRILFEYLFPLVLPALIYLAWLANERRRIARAQAGVPPRWQDAPWLWLAVLGVLLATVLTFGLALLGSSGTKGRYVPPRVEDGRVLPGHIDPAEQKR